MRFGYFLSCEEYTAARARRAGPAGRGGRLRGAVDQRPLPPVERRAGAEPVRLVGDRRAVAKPADLPVTTAVTCPTVRIHPAVIAQAAATSAVMLDGRFTLGVGTGEALNEHILGDAWPTARRAARDARGGGRGHPRSCGPARSSRHDGTHYTVDTARIYTLPDEPPPSLRLRLRTRRPPTWPPGSATATSPPARTPSCSASSVKQVGRQAHPGRASRCAGRRQRGRGRRDRPPALGQQRRCPASSPRCCRHPSTSSRRPSWSPRR